MKEHIYNETIIHVINDRVRPYTEGSHPDPERQVPHVLFHLLASVFQFEYISKVIAKAKKVKGDHVVDKEV